MSIQWGATQGLFVMATWWYDSSYYNQVDADIFASGSSADQSLPKVARGPSSGDRDFGGVFFKGDSNTSDDDERIDDEHGEHVEFPSFVGETEAHIG